MTKSVRIQIDDEMFATTGELVTPEQEAAYAALREEERRHRGISFILLTIIQARVLKVPDADKPECFQRFAGVFAREWVKFSRSQGYDIEDAASNTVPCSPSDAPVNETSTATRNVVAHSRAKKTTKTKKRHRRKTLGGIAAFTLGEAIEKKRLRKKAKIKIS